MQGSADLFERASRTVSGISTAPLQRLRVSDLKAALFSLPVFGPLMRASKELPVGVLCMILTGCRLLSNGLLCSGPREFMLFGRSA